MAITRTCRRCNRVCVARSQFCHFHKLLKQPPHVQAAAADERMAASQTVGRQVPKSQWPDGERWCFTCQSFCADFYFNGSKCRGCSAKSTHAARVQQTYGISGEQYDALLRAQDGRCAICTNKPGKKRFAVDHNHQTGEVRGLLCATCNHRLLGAARDSVEMLQRAIDYLEAPPARKVL